MNDIAALPARHRLDVHAYHRMGEAGIFAPEDRVELIDGDLIDMAPISQGHAAIVNGLTEALVLACAGRAIVSTQNPIRLDLSSEPQPDLAVLRRRPDFYATGTPPGPADTLLLIEVANTSLRFDRIVKLPLYARAGIPEVWIVDLNRRVIEAFRTPEAGTYRNTATHRPGDHVCLSLVPDIIVPLILAFPDPAPE